MIIFLSIIAAISFLDALFEEEKVYMQAMAMICCAAIVAIAIITMNQ